MLIWIDLRISPSQPHYLLYKGNHYSESEGHSVVVVVVVVVAAFRIINAKCEFGTRYEFLFPHVTY
jgi:hypothetical protein